MNYCDLTERLKGGVEPLQALCGQGGVIAQNMEALGLEMSPAQPKPEMASPAPEAWSPILDAPKGPEL